MYFSKYLKEMGHNPIVITVDEKYASYNQKDYSLLKEIDNIEINPSMIQPISEIKMLGTFKVNLNLHSEIQSNINIKVIAEEDK